MRLPFQRAGFSQGLAICFDALAASRMFSIRPRSRPAVSGILFQIGLRMARTSSAVIASTGFTRSGLACVLIVLRHRSEEHTSELQSLMRISYAVFCLKNKKHVR